MMNPAEFANIARAEQDFWWYRGMREILFRMLDPIASANRLERVIEAGCGTGHLSQVLGRRYGWQMFPLDLGCEGLDYARGYGVTRLVQGDVTSLPFGAAEFDALLSIDVIPHLERGQEHRALAEFARVLKPGGLLVVRAAALEVLRSKHSEFAHERQRFTSARLRSVVERAGFRVHRMTYANALLLPVALFKFRVWEPMARQPAASGVVPVAKWVDGLLSVPLGIEAGWIGRGGSFPAGQSLVVIAHKS